MYKQHHVTLSVWRTLHTLKTYTVTALIFENLDNFLYFYVVEMKIETVEERFFPFSVVPYLLSLPNSSMAPGWDSSFEAFHITKKRQPESAVGESLHKHTDTHQ